MYAKKNQWLVDLKESAEAASTLNDLGLGQIFRRTLGRPDLALVQLPDGAGYEQLAGGLSARGALDVAEPNGIVVKAATPNDQHYSKQWGLHNTGQTIQGRVGTSDADIDAPSAWDLTTGSSSVVVAVIDDGIDFAHPDLSDNKWINDGETADDDDDNDLNGIDDDVNGADFSEAVPDGDPTPVAGATHGTNIAGVIGAKAQTAAGTGTGIAGIAWNVEIMALKVFDDDFGDFYGGATGWDALILAIDYVIDIKTRGTHPANVRVINASIAQAGGTESAAMKSAIEDLQDPDGNPNTDDGILFVTAAHNYGNNNDDEHTPVWPANTKLDNIISVAATDNNDVLADFAHDSHGFSSNFGPNSVDLGAPGRDIYSTTFSGTTTRTYGYGYFNGTSMAAPMVSGVAVLAFAYKPAATYQEVRDAILQGTDATTALTGTTVTGGRLNARNALDLVGSVATNTTTTTGNDTIVIRRKSGDNTKLEVAVTPQGGATTTTEYTLANVSWLRVHGKAGDDVFDINEANGSISIPLLLAGGPGADSIEGGGGNDWLIGGDDWLNGSTDGNDTLTGNGGNDILTGGAGVDSVTGGAGNDRLNGGDGDDTTLTGGDDHDYVGGGDGDDTLDGNGGNDVLTGGTGDDELRGGTGNDTYVFTKGWGVIDDISYPEDTGNDTVVEGYAADTDTIDLTSFNTNNTIYLTIAQDAAMTGLTLDDSYHDGSGFDHLRNTAIENINGREHRYFHPLDDDPPLNPSLDELQGNTRNNTIWGLGGDDTIVGRGGTDTLHGGDGDDRFRMANLYDNTADGAHDGTGDVLNGNAGTDTADYTERTQNLNISHDNVANDGQVDTDPGPGLVPENDNVKTDVEIVKAGSAVDTLTSGSSGGATLHGGGGTDTLYGGTGNDTLLGEGGNDQLFGRGGNDVVDGGADNDHVFGDELNNADISGTDTVRGGDGADWCYGGPGTDTVLGDEGNDHCYGDDPGIDETVYGGADSVNGGDGNDKCYGGYGNDTLVGGLFDSNDGNDTMFGGAGNDQFYAGDGFIDTLYGGGGTDTATNRDGNDVIPLSDIEVL